MTSRTFYQSWFLIFPCTICHRIPEKAENFQIENILLTALVDVLGVVLADLALVDLLVVSVDVLDWWGWFCCSPSWLMPLPLHILGISLIKNCLKHNDLNFHHNSHAYNFLNIHNCTYDIWNCMSQHFELHHKIWNCTSQCTWIYSNYFRGCFWSDTFHFSTKKKMDF